MRRGLLIIWFVFLVALGGGAWWYLFAPGTVPAGQRPLGTAADFERAFQAGVGGNRLVAVLSPTTPADLAMAQQLQGLLMAYENDQLEAHVVWIPEKSTDWAPTTDAMARVADPRARHYWDKEKRVKQAAGEGSVFLYARGAALQQPVLRVKDWTADAGKIREYLGTPRPDPTFR